MKLIAATFPANAVPVPTSLPAPAPTLPPPGTRPAIFMGWGPKVYA